MIIFAGFNSVVPLSPELKMLKMLFWPKAFTFYELCSSPSLLIFFGFEIILNAGFLLNNNMQLKLNEVKF